MDFSTNMLEKVAVDRKYLATNFADIVPDCSGAGADPKTQILTQFPLVSWLINTPLSTRVRQGIASNGQCMMHKNSDGKWVLEVPRTAWTLPPASTKDECCWTSMDFAKCEGTVPLNLLCLKDCNNVIDELMGDVVTISSGLAGIANKGETIETVRKRVAKMSMAFLTAYNVILGIDDTYTDVLKPFHGLLSVMENAAVTKVLGTNILGAFDSVACRLAVLGMNDVIFATHPVIYEAIKQEVVKGQNGEYPTGWSRNGDEITFNGIKFIRDYLVPVDLTAGTGEVWVLSGDSVGLYLMTDLMPRDKFIKSSGHVAGKPADGCGNDCDYYYNIGSAFNNNAMKVMAITDIPVGSVCAAATSDLSAVINPTSFIPAE